MPPKPKMPDFNQIHANVQSRLRINPKVMQESVPQLQFSPSIGIIARDIDRLGMDIRSFREPLTRAIKQVVIPSIQRNFTVGGRPAWEPYSPGTIEIRDRMGSPVGSLLNKTGALQRVMGQVNLWTINNNAAILLDIPLWYGKLHQQGYGNTMGAAIAKAGSASKAFKNINDAVKQSIKTGTQIQSVDLHIPARPFVVLQEEDLPAIQRVFEAWLAERVAKHWGSRG
jgi:phage gpG-like protein